MPVQAFHCGGIKHLPFVPLTCLAEPMKYLVCGHVDATVLVVLSICLLYPNYYD